MTEIPSVRTGDPEILRAYAQWIRLKAAESEIDAFRWLMDGLAAEIERVAVQL